MTDEQLQDMAVRAAMAAAGSPSHVDPRILMDESEGTSGLPDYHGYNPGGGDGGSVSLKGSGGDAEFIQSERYRFASGVDSNVVVSLDKDDVEDDGTPRIKIDVYYV